MTSSREIGVSLLQHRYYRAAILPAIREYCGYESDALAHQALKEGFYNMHPADPNLPSMADMTQDEASRFMEYALRQAAEMDCIIPDPEPSEVKPMAPKRNTTPIRREDSGGDDCAFAVGRVAR